MADSNFEVTVGYMRPALELLKALDIKIESLIDIGANMGHFGELAQDVLGDIIVTSFEPNKDCNDYIKGKKFFYALGASDARLELYKDPNDPTSGGNSLYKEQTDYYKDPKVEIVPIRTLDSFYVNGDLIKIDVQGAELDVLRGGSRTIKAAKALLIELSFIEYNKHGCLIDDVLKKTKEYGFRVIYTFGPINGIHWYQGRPAQIDALLVREDIDVFSVV